MKKIILLASACLIGACASLGYADSTSNDTTAPSLVGNYKCSGTNFENNKKYNSKMNIVQTDKTYQFIWTSSDGKYKGTGLLGEDSSMLIVAFKKMNDSSFSGAQLYKISQDGSTFDGRWVIIGKKTVGAETCQKLT